MLVGLLMIAVGIALAGVTAWFWKASRIDNPVLAPLEVIGERAFKDADEDTRKAMLRDVRTTVEP